MVGRERELDAGRALLAGVVSGPGCLLLEGEPGIGKTTVWREIVRDARARDYPVLSCRPAATEAKLSFAGLADLLSEVEESAFAGLAAPQRHALEVALLRASPGPQPPEQRAVFAGFCAVLFALAAEGPILVAVDDAQWLDRPSLAALEFAVRRLRDRRIAVLCAARIGETAGLATGLARALEEGGAGRVRLGPLSVAALHELIVERLGCGLARPTMVRLSTEARGNPFFALEIARELARRGEHSPGEALPVPEDLSQLVVGRIRRLPRATRDQLLAAAALSHPSVELLDQVALEPAVRAGLIEIGRERVSFSHPLFATAMYASAPSPERRALHRRLALLVSDPEERARHVALGAGEPSEQIALELERAANLAVSRGAPGAAAELLELAVRLTPPGGEQAAGRVLMAADCHFHAGDHARARSLAEQLLAERPDGAVRGHALRVLGQVRYHADSFAEALPVLEEALGLIDEESRAVELHLSLSYANANLGRSSAAASHAQAALETATRIGDPGLLASALAMSAKAQLALGQPLDRTRLESALALEDLDRQMLMPLRPSRVAGVAEFLSDNFERATELYSRVRQLAIDRGEDSHLPMVDVDLAWTARLRGELVAALSFADEGCEIARAISSQTAQAEMLGERSHVRATLGDIDGARADAEEAMALARESDVGITAIWPGIALGFLALSLGDPRTASDALEPMCASVEAAGVCSPLAATVVPDIIEALVALGALERADALTALLERHARDHERASALASAARCRALLAAARGDTDEALRQIEVALAQHARVQMPLELGRSLLIKGQVERRRKRKRSSREALQQALEIFDEIGARLWAERARSELARTGIRRVEGDALTPTELQVAELAANGMTNRQIAEGMFLSAKTIEANLARVYLKLGIRSRAELGRAMAERERVVAGAPGHHAGSSSAG